MSSIEKVPVYSTWNNNTHPQWWRDKGLRKMVLCLTSIYAACFTFGYDGSLLASLLIMPQWKAYFNNPVGNTLGLIAASFYFPKIVAPLPAAWCSDRYGRRPTMFIGSCICIAGALVVSLSNSQNMFIGGRVILGFGSGFKQTVAPYYLQELAHPRIRAACGSLYYLSYFLGTICAGWFGFAVLGWQSEWSWRTLTLLQALGSIWTVLLVLLGVMSESPRWLLNVGRKDEAHRVLAKYHANGDLDDELVVNELAEMEEVQRTAVEANAISLREFIRTPGNRRRTAVVVVSASGTQLSGSVLISAYLGPILTSVGITSPSQQVALLSGLNMLGLVVVVLVASFGLERIGRRPIWLVGLTGQAVFFLVFIGLSAGYDATKNPMMGVATIPMIYLYFGCYCATWSALSAMYCTEILPTTLRSKGIGIYIFVLSIAVTYNQYVNPIALQAIAWRYYFLFFALQLFFLVFAYFFYLETKGMTMEEVGNLFGRLLALLPALMLCERNMLMSADGKDQVEAIQARIYERPARKIDGTEVEHVEVKQ